MMMLVLTAEQKAQLDALNQSGDSSRRLFPAVLTDGRYGLNTDLLDDMSNGRTWQHYAAFLESLSEEDVSSLIPEDGEE